MTIMQDENYVYKIYEIRQRYRKTRTERFKVNSPDAAVGFLREEIGDRDREVAYVLGMNTKNEVTVCFEVSVGSVNATVVQPREVFKPLILNSCTGFIFAHNHPSGSAENSQEDVEMSERLEAAGHLLNIQLLDSIIVTDEEHLSMKQNGII